MDPSKENEVGSLQPQGTFWFNMFASEAYIALFGSMPTYEIGS